MAHIASARAATAAEVSLLVFCAAVACGVHPSYEDACRAMVRMARVHEPQHELAAIYQKKYARYLRLLDVFGPVWSELAWPAG